MTSDKLYAGSGNIIPKDELATLAGELREFRLDQDLTYLQLSALIGISKSVLQRIECGTLNQNARTVRKLKRFLEATRAA
jgi:transcriptional regulator with XRE-family HTH domain